MFVRTPTVLNLRNYKGARAYYESVKPLRSRKNPDLRPLFGGSTLSDTLRKLGRTKTFMDIRKSGENIIARLYNTDLITFRPDNTVVVNCGGYPTISTNEVISAVLGVRVSNQCYKQWMVSPRSYNWREWQNEAKYLHSTGDNLLKWMPKLDKFSVSPSQVPTRTVVNRVKARRLMQQYYDFRKYVRRMVKLSADPETGKMRVGVDGSMRGRENSWLDWEETQPLIRNGLGAEQYGKAFLSLVDALASSSHFWWGNQPQEKFIGASNIMEVVRIHVYKNNRNLISKEEVIKSPATSRDTI